MALHRGAHLALATLAACGQEVVPLDRDGASCARSDCRVTADYGDLGMVGGGAALTGGGVALAWSGRLADECGERLVELEVQLFSGRGVFDRGIEPGTYPIDRDEIDRQTCGACIELVADPGTDDRRCYFASGGQLILTSTVDDLSGSLADVTFAPVSCSTFTPSEEPCGSAIAGLTFDEPIGGEPD